jgi:hypothetical protein
MLTDSARAMMNKLAIFIGQIGESGGTGFVTSQGVLRTCEDEEY